MTKSRAGTSHKVLRWIQYSLLILGLTCVGAWVGSNVTLLVWQDWQNWVFDRQIAGQPHSVGGYLENKEASVLRRPSPPLVVSSVTKRPPPVATNAVLGRIVIPRLELRTIVREGDGQDTLQVAAGHIPGTAFPGQAGNVGVAGHRDTLFRGLRTIRPYDVIQFQTLNNRFYYQVESTQVVKPQDVGVLKPKKYSELTLVTCYPFDFLGSAPDRFIVTARQIPAPADPATEQEDDPPPTEAAPAPASIASAPVASAAIASIAQRNGTDDVPAPGKEIFTIEKDHSRQLAPGISIGITDTNAGDRRVNGWMWLLADRRTIWLRDQSTSDPVVFYSAGDGRRHELRITQVTPNSATGYYRVLPSE
jgi:sortase A